LAQHRLCPWLDEEQIRPGTSWQTALGQQIESIKSAAVFVDESGVGPWQNQEIQGLLSRFVERQCAVIPVILPSAKTTPKLPWPLENLHRVDFRQVHVDPLKLLIWGITGEKPAELSHVHDSENPGTVPEIEGHLLRPSGTDQIAKKRWTVWMKSRPRGSPNAWPRSTRSSSSLTRQDSWCAAASWNTSGCPKG
jgi:hypothetical protein